MDTFAGLINGFSIALTPVNVLFGFLGALFGTAIGVLPGLGPAATIALLLPVTYAIDSPVTAIILMAGIFYGSMYGGSTTSILLNLPGEAASVVTCIDGYQMARKGRAGVALGIAAIGSFVAGTVGVIGLTLFAPPIAEFALSFGPPEKFSLAVVGLLLAVTLSGSSIIKGLVMMALGLLLASVGLDPISGKTRFSFGVIELQSGFDFVTLAMGVFGLGEIFCGLESVIRSEAVTTKVGQVWPTMKDWVASRMAILRGTLVGFFIGVIPGGGAVISSLVSYAVEKKVSRHPEEFGQGAIEGVAGPESANNAASSSSFIPLLTLGIPGNASIAMIFAALLIKGVTPGPFLIQEHPDVFWGVIASMYIGNVMLLDPQPAPRGALGPARPGPVRDHGPRHHPLHRHRFLQHPGPGVRHLQPGRIRPFRLPASQAQVRTRAPGTGLRAGAHGRIVDAAVASHVGGELLNLPGASHLDGPDRTVRASRHRSIHRDVAKEIKNKPLKGEEI